MSLKEQLGSKLAPVGIKISEGLLGRPIEKPEYFDRLVRESALTGKTFVVTNDKLTDPYSHVSLGFEEPKFVKDYEPRIKKRTRSVKIGPLEDADVILFILNPEKGMRLIFLLCKKDAEFKCTAAVSGEAIAKVYNEQKPNLTLLCGGARVYGKFKDDEFIISIPKKIYDKIKDKEVPKYKLD